MNSEQPLGVIALLLVRGGERILVPASDTPIHIGDRILFAGTRDAGRMVHRNGLSRTDLHYITTGSHLATSHFGRWIERIKRRQTSK